MRNKFKNQYLYRAITKMKKKDTKMRKNIEDR